jgi:hypothetical protein
MTVGVAQSFGIGLISASGYAAERTSLGVLDEPPPVAAALAAVAGAVAKAFVGVEADVAGVVAALPCGLTVVAPLEPELPAILLQPIAKTPTMPTLVSALRVPFIAVPLSSAPAEEAPRDQCGDCDEQPGAHPGSVA